MENLVILDGCSRIGQCSSTATRLYWRIEQVEKGGCCSVGYALSNFVMPSKEKQRDRVLRADEIHQLWQHLDETEISLPVRQAIKLILVTAQRKGEVIMAKWSNIDGNWWTIPPEKPKCVETIGKFPSSYSTPYLTGIFLD